MVVVRNHLISALLPFLNLEHINYNDVGSKSHNGEGGGGRGSLVKPTRITKQLSNNDIHPPRSTPCVCICVQIP
jgi:hypothetical protein